MQIYTQRTLPPALVAFLLDRPSRPCQNKNMPNKLSASQALGLLATTADAVDAAVTLCGENTVAGSTARLVSLTLSAHASALGEMASWLVSNGRFDTPSQREMPPRGGPGAAAPKRGSTEPRAGATGDNDAKEDEHGHPPTTPPQDWEDDFSTSMGYIEDPPELYPNATDAGY